MRDDNPIVKGSPESFGWQRRPDLDTETGVAYEQPDGVFYLFPKGKKPTLARFKGYCRNRLDHLYKPSSS
jgi:hypothetical protein